MNGASTAPATEMIVFPYFFQTFFSTFLIFSSVFVTAFMTFASIFWSAFGIIFLATAVWTL